MDFLSTLFFESPIYLGIFSLFLLGASLYVRRARPTTVGRWSVPAALGLILLLLGVQRIVTTERERIRTATQEFVAAVERKDLGAIRAALSPAYSADEMNADAMTEYLESVLARLRLYDSRLMRREVTVRGRDADLLLTARATVSVEGGIGDMHWGTWKIGWTKEGETWRITSLVPVVIDGVPFDSLRQLRPYVP